MRTGRASRLLGLALVLAAGSARADLAPKKASDAVTVRAGEACSSGPAGALKMSQLYTPEEVVPFVIPAKRVLMITDVQFIIQQATASTTLYVQLGVPCGPACMTPLVDGYLATDANGRGAVQIPIPSGVRVPAGIELCGSDQSASPNLRPVIHGFFAPDK